MGKRVRWEGRVGLGRLGVKESEPKQRRQAGHWRWTVVADLKLGVEGEGRSEMVSWMGDVVVRALRWEF